jgi:two-component system, OmpR family, sensor kinase
MKHRAMKHRAMKLTRRIVIRSLVVLALALLTVSALTYEFVRDSGRQDLDRFLRNESDQLIAGFIDAAADSAGADATLSAPEAARAARTALAVHPSGPQHVAVITVDGLRIQSSGGPPTIATLLRSDAVPAPEPGQLRTFDTDIGPIRMLELELTDRDGSAIALVTLVAPLDPSRYAATNALNRTLLAGAIALVLAGGLLTLMVRRSLQPLGALSTAAAAIHPDTLAARVPVPDTDDEVQQLATELNEMLERLNDNDRTRRRYLAAISHEVRTPLTVAEGHLELLENNQIDPATAAATVRQELDRLRRVLDDLLSVARSGDEIDIRPGPIFLPDLFAAIATRIEALGLTSRVRLDAPPAAAFTGDQARIEQSISNLISNAIDHNPPDTAVTISATATSETVSIAVIDNGTGIDPEILPKVREPFFSTRTSGQRRTSGLGLTVVDSLTEAQHGTLDLRSSPTGTTATLTYPTQPPA